MNRAAFLEEKYRELSAQYYEALTEFYAHPSIAWIEPFKIADGLYYVGDRKVCVHLIDTGDGLILIDSGFPSAMHLLVDSIWRAGFDPKEVRWIVHTHGHYDHFGASEEFRRLYGTKLAISRVDAEALKRPHTSAINEKTFPFVTAPTFDHEIEDGEVFSLGRVSIRCVLTPGHTAGVLSLFFDVVSEGQTYLAGLLGGVGTAAMTLPYTHHNNLSADMPQQMLRSIERVWDEPVAVHLGNHPSNNRTLQKREQQLLVGGNPFVAPESWHTFLEGLKEQVERIIRSNEELEEEMKAMFGAQDGKG